MTGRSLVVVSYLALVECEPFERQSFLAAISEQCTAQVANCFHLVVVLMASPLERRKDARFQKKPFILAAIDPGALLRLAGGH